MAPKKSKSKRPIQQQEEEDTEESTQTMNRGQDQGTGPQDRQLQGLMADARRSGGRQGRQGSGPSKDPFQIMLESMGSEERARAFQFLQAQQQTQAQPSPRTQARHSISTPPSHYGQFRGADFEIPQGQFQGGDFEPLQDQVSGGYPGGFQGLFQGAQQGHRGSFDLRSDFHGVKYHYRELVKSGIPTFDGRSGPDAAEDWLAEIERRFEMMEVPEAIRPRVVPSFLGGEAAKWWRGMEPVLAQQEQSLTWPVFRRVFLHQFFPDSLRMGRIQEFHAFRQGPGMTVMEYFSRFTALG